MNVASNLRAVRARIHAAAVAAGRDPADVSLLAVGKAQPAIALQAAWDAGQRAFGENYLQEAVPHIDLLPAAEWHFIGRMQANKSRTLAERFAWVHTVDRVRIAQRLDAQRPTGAPPLNVCIQVNLDDDPAKGGVDADAASALADVVAGLPNLRLRGLMSVPRARTDAAGQRAAFAAVRQLYDALRDRGVPLDTLSIGMSADLEAAIAAGATLVRIGTDIFGPRR